MDDAADWRWKEFQKQGLVQDPAHPVSAKLVNWRLTREVSPRPVSSPFCMCLCAVKGPGMPRRRLGWTLH